MGVGVGVRVGVAVGVAVWVAVGKRGPGVGETVTVAARVGRNGKGSSSLQPLISKSVITGARTKRILKF
jgi:hypothetical protein